MNRDRERERETEIEIERAGIRQYSIGVMIVRPWAGLIEPIWSWDPVGPFRPVTHLDLGPFGSEPGIAWAHLAPSD